MSDTKDSGAPDEPRTHAPHAAEPEAPAPDPDKTEHASATGAEEPPPPPPSSDEREAVEAEKEPAREPLLRAGNKLRPLRGGLTLGAGVLVAFVIMALRPQFRIGVPLGALGVLVATFGLLDLLGAFDDEDSRVARRISLSALGAPFAVLAASALGLFAFVSLAVAGIISPLLAGTTIPICFLGMVIGVYRVGDALSAWEPGPDGAPLPLYKRHGFWLVALATLLYLPMLGSHSLSDPWETHYGEVSREILSRNDWISLWWAQEGWFWSKPIFDFWIQALAMATFGVRYAPGKMLSAAAEGHNPWPEWAVRLPIFLLTLLAIYLLYKAVARVWGRRAGLLGGIVLTTMPQWFLVSHQTMTDMPFVATMSAAMALFILGIHEDSAREVRAVEVRVRGAALRVSSYHLVLGAVIACALPQILYLFSRNLEIIPQPFSIHLRPDVFNAGSPGNCGLPGNEACKQVAPVLRGLFPALQALLWIQSLGLLLYICWGERRTQRLFFLAAWFFAALSTMAKGAAGAGLPVICAFAYLLVSRRFRDLLRMEIVAGFLIILAVAMPWFVAMYGRHGQPFTDRLIFHDMFKRAFTHVHDTNEGDDVGFRYYLWQLGYAMFPWTGLAPVALVHWLRRPEEDDRRSDASIFLATWFVFAFALFTLMLTKFHHYILPALPPAAMLTGVLLDEMVRQSGALMSAAPAAAQSSRARLLRSLLYGLGIGGATLLLLAGFARLLAPLPSGALTPGTRTVAARLAAILSHSGYGLAAVGLGIGLFLVTSILLGRRRALASDAPDAGEGATLSFVQQYERILLGAAGAAGGLVVFLVGRDLAGSREGMVDQVRLLQLFTYNYRRVFPASLDFHPTLWAFTIVAAIFTFGLIAARARRHMVTALCATAVLFTAWGIDSYFVKTSPHWGQRETALAYFRATRDIPGPIIAYQMNWKGENFYTGNAIPAFVNSGKKFQDYILEEKKKGVKTFYFFSEHGRMGSLANELGNPRIFDKITAPEVNNKFGLVRATFE